MMMRRKSFANSSKMPERTVAMRSPIADLTPTVCSGRAIFLELANSTNSWRRFSRAMPFITYGWLK